MKSLMQAKKSKYNDLIFKYGIVALLYIIKDFEEAENYEECAVIIKAINNINETYLYYHNIEYMPTTIRGLNVIEFVNSAYCDLTTVEANCKAQYYLDHLNEYIDRAKDEIKLMNHA